MSNGNVVVAVLQTPEFARHDRLLFQARAWQDGTFQSQEFLTEFQPLRAGLEKVNDRGEECKSGLAGAKELVYVPRHLRPVCRKYRGEVPEWLNGAVSKTVERASVPGVRIPLSPPLPFSTTDCIGLLERQFLPPEAGDVPNEPEIFRTSCLRQRPFCFPKTTVTCARFRQSFEWLPSHKGAASDFLQPQKNARPSFSAVNFTGERPVSL